MNVRGMQRPHAAQMGRALSFLAISLALAAAGSTHAQAQIALSLPDGADFIHGFNPGPGNMLFQKADTNPLTLGSRLEVYYQANISSINGTNNLPDPKFAGLNAKYELTEVARFTEVVSSISSIPNGATFTLAMNPVQVNPFFEIWFHSPAADNLAGTGFALGTKILAGVIGSAPANTLTFTNPTSFPPIDNPSPDTGGTATGKAFWSTTTTVQATGIAQLGLNTHAINSVVLNSAFFPGSPVIDTFVLNPSYGLEYQNVDPSQQFDALPNGGGFIVGIAPGTQNGPDTGDRFEVEVGNGNTLSGTGGRLPNGPSVPEPGTLAMLAGLVIPGALLMRRRK